MPNDSRLRGETTYYHRKRLLKYFSVVVSKRRFEFNFNLNSCSKKRNRFTRHGGSEHWTFACPFGKRIFSYWSDTNSFYYAYIYNIKKNCSRVMLFYWTNTRIVDPWSYNCIFCIDLKRNKFLSELIVLYNCINIRKIYFRIISQNNIFFYNLYSNRYIDT